MNRLKDYLKKFGYNFLDQGDKVIIKMEKKFEVIVTLNNEIYSINGTTTPWSPLTGSFKMSIYNSLVMNSIGFILLFVGLEFLKFSKYQYDYTYLLIISTFLYLMWFTYYLVKYEILKSKIEQILNEKEL